MNIPRTYPTRSRTRNMANHAEIAALVEEKVKEQVKDLNERINGLVNLVERVVCLLKHLVKENQAHFSSNTNSCFGMLGPNPKVLPDPVRFNRYPGPVISDQRRATQRQHRDHQKRVIPDRPSVPKEWGFTQLLVAVSIIWPILLKKGLVLREKKFSMIEMLTILIRTNLVTFIAVAPATH